MTQPPAPLHAAIDTESLLATAGLYSKRLEADCFPVIGKEPALGYKWRETALEEPGVYTATLKHWRAATGYAIAPRSGSNLVICEVDQMGFKEPLREAIPAIDQSLRTLRAGRPHYYLKLQCALPKAYLSLKDADGREIASLRGAGSYVIGPYSVHPDGDVYIPAGNMPLELDLIETQKLLALFGERPSIKAPHRRKNPQGGAPISEIDNQGMWERLGESIGDINYVGKALVESTMQALSQRGYKARWDGQRQVWWLNGQCPNHAAHANGDKHPSFGYNSQGVGYCFVCGPMLTIQVADLLGIERRASRPSPSRDRRSDLIERKLTLSVRLVDLLHALAKRIDRRGKVHRAATHFSIHQLLEAGRRVGWSRSCTYRNIQQGIQAGLLKRVRRGLYECNEQFESPAPAKPWGPGYSEHPAEYRRAWLMQVERQLQPARPTIYNLSAASIAWRAGIRERTLYRYEKRLGIRRIQVWKRSELPTIPGPDGQPVPYLPDQGQKGYQRLEVVNRVETLQRFDFRHGHALNEAIQVAGEWGGVVLLAERKTSIRVLPGQDARERVPGYGTLSWDERHFTVDPPQLEKLLKMVSPTPSSIKGIARLRACAGAQRAIPNDSDLSVKVETKAINLHGQWVGGRSGRAWADPKERQSGRQQPLFEF
jgi:hypothetical protein